MRTGELYQRYYGVFAGTVIDVDDPEKLGRVRIECDQFEDASDDVFWASVARPAAGDKTGVFFTPKKGDQVIIGYLTGDVDEPVVLGYAHSAKRKPPAQVSAKKHAIVTDIGHVVFDEEGGSITVTFSSPESFIKLDKDGITIQAPKVQIVSTAPGPTGIELRSDLAPVRISSTTNVGLLAPILTFAGIPSFGGFTPGVTPPLPPLNVPIPWDFSQFDVAIQMGDKEFCVNGQGVLLKGFAQQLFNAHTHAGTGTPTSGLFDPAAENNPTIVTHCEGP